MEGDVVAVRYVYGARRFLGYPTRSVVGPTDPWTAIEDPRVAPTRPRDRRHRTWARKKPGTTLPAH